MVSVVVVAETRGMRDWIGGLRTKSSLNCARPTLRATSDDAMANWRLNFASKAVCGRSLRSISICIAPVDTWT